MHYPLLYQYLSRICFNKKYRFLLMKLKWVSCRSWKAVKLNEAIQLLICGPRKKTEDRKKIKYNPDGQWSQKLPKQQ